MESSILLMGDVAYDARFSVCSKRNTLRYSHRTVHLSHSMAHRIIQSDFIKDIIIRRITTSPFKSMYFQIFWQNYCRKTIEATTAKKYQMKEN